MPTRIFISYRRDDAKWPARELYKALVRVLPRDNVFIDIDTIGLGDDFVVTLERWVDQCDILLALIGKGWASACDPESGKRRLDASDDYVRAEIRKALVRRIPVVPVLLDGALMPDAAELPEDISALARRQAERIDYRTFETDAARIIGKLLVGRSDGASIVDDNEQVEGRRLIRVFRGHNEGVRSVAIAPGGHIALSGGGDRVLRLWELASGRQIRDFAGHDAAVNCVAFAPDGGAALSGAYDGTVRLWDLSTGRQLQRFAHGATAVAFAPDGRTALSASYGGAVHILDLASGREIRVLKHARVTSVAIAPDGLAALSGGTTLERRFLGFTIGRNKTLRLWDLSSGGEIHEYCGGTEPVNFVAFAPDGQTALSGYLEIVLWDLRNGRRIRTFGKGANAVAFAPDGRTALSANFTQSVSLWELASGREIDEFSGHTDAVNSVAFAPDGRTALSGSSDKTLRLWDLTGL